MIRSRGVDLFFLEDVVDEIISTHEKLPSVYQVLQMIGNRKNQDVDKKDRDFNQKLKTENDKFELAKKEIVGVLGEDAIGNFIPFWLKYVFGADLESDLKTMDLKLTLFEKPAVFDLHEAKCDPKKAVVIGRKKQARLQTA